jgi:hypothetical protein
MHHNTMRRAFGLGSTVRNISNFNKRSFFEDLVFGSIKTRKDKEDA